MIQCRWDANHEPQNLWFETNHGPLMHITSPYLISCHLSIVIANDGITMLIWALKMRQQACYV